MIFLILKSFVKNQNLNSTFFLSLYLGFVHGDITEGASGGLNNIPVSDLGQNQDPAYFQFFAHHRPSEAGITSKEAPSGETAMNIAINKKSKDRYEVVEVSNEQGPKHLGIPSRILDSHNKAVSNNMVGYRRKKKKKRVGRKVRSQELESFVLDFIKERLSSQRKIPLLSPLRNSLS